MSLDTLTGEEQLYAVFAAYGRAMLNAHGLELQLATLLSVRTIFAGGTKDERIRALARIEQQPMGNLIRDFIASYEPSEEIMEELDNMLYFRNELAHRVSRMILIAATKGDWKIPLIKELTEISEMFRDTGRLLEPFMEACRNQVGVPEEIMQELGRHLYPGAAHAA